MGKTEEDWNWLKLGFLKTVHPNSFSKLIPAACNFKNNGQDTYLFVTDLRFCHLHQYNFFAYFKFHRDWGRVIGKIKQNELDCRDTAPLILRPEILDSLIVWMEDASFVLSAIQVGLPMRLTLPRSNERNKQS